MIVFRTIKTVLLKQQLVHEHSQSSLPSHFGNVKFYVCKVEGSTIVKQSFQIQVVNGNNSEERDGLLSLRSN